MSEKDFGIYDGVLTEYHGHDIDIIIPDGVTEIGEFALSGFVNTHYDYRAKLNRKIKSVFIPNTVIVIKENAFTDCISLEEVTLSEGLQTIEVNAFSGCNSLKSINIPKGVSEIGRFQHCTSLKTVNLPDTITYIGVDCFNLKKLIFQIVLNVFCGVHLKIVLV